MSKFQIGDRVITKPLSSEKQRFTGTIISIDFIPPVLYKIQFDKLNNGMGIVSLFDYQIELFRTSKPNKEFKSLWDALAVDDE